MLIVPSLRISQKLCPDLVTISQVHRSVVSQPILIFRVRLTSGEHCGEGGNSQVHSGSDDKIDLLLHGEILDGETYCMKVPQQSISLADSEDRLPASVGPVGGPPHPFSVIR